MTFLDISVGSLEVTNNVRQSVRLILILHDLSVQRTRLGEVIIGVGRFETANQTSDSLDAELSFRLGLVGVERIGFIVGLRSLVAINRHRAITLSIGDLGSVRAVHGDLIVVRTESVSVGVGVREETSLEHLVQRGFHAGHEVAGRERSLLSFSEVVLRVSVENELANGHQRIVSMRPHLGHIENVPSVLVAIVDGHNLHVQRPRSATTLSDVLEEIFSSVVRVGGLQSISFTCSEVLDSLVGLEVQLNPVSFTLVVHPLESVRAVTVHLSVAIGGTSVGEQDGDLVSRLRSLREEVPSHVGALQVGLRVSLLGVDEIRELNGVSNEEDWGVVANHIPVAFFSVELNGETSGISLGISRSLLTTDGGETSEDGGSLADGIEELSLADLGDIVSGFEITVRTSTLGVDDTLGDSLAIEVSQLVNQVEILEQNRAELSCSHRVLVIVDGRAGRSRQSR